MFEAGVFKVISATELEAVTRQGWSLVQILEGSGMPEQVTATVPLRHRDSSGYEYNTMEPATLLVPTRLTLFLVCLDADSALGAAAVQLLEAQLAQKMAEVALAEALKEKTDD